MKRYLFFSLALLILLAMPLVLLARAGGLKSQTLDRGTALTLIRTALGSEDILRDDSGDGPTQHSGGIVKCPFETHILTEPLTPAVSKFPAHVQRSKHLDAEAAFYDVLVQVGILKDKKTTNQADSEGYVHYRYSIVPQDNVGSRPSAFAGSPPTLMVTLAKPTVKEVLGIRQEGSNAIAEVSINWAPTAAYEKITAAGASAFAQCKLSPAEPSVFFVRPDCSCGNWPSREALAKTVKRSVRFARYDDGWRVMKRD